MLSMSLRIDIELLINFWSPLIPFIFSSAHSSLQDSLRRDRRHLSVRLHRFVLRVDAVAQLSVEGEEGDRPLQRVHSNKVEINLWLSQSCPRRRGDPMPASEAVLCRERCEGCLPSQVFAHQPHRGERGDAARTRPFGGRGEGANSKSKYEQIIDPWRLYSNLFALIL